MNQPCIEERRRKTVGLWLLALAAMILVNVVLGGLTRLTGSGLSMVEWQPLSVLPPLSDAAWAEMFAKYRESPQFQLVNDHMDLAGFKGIFWLEFIHRNWGRLLGFAFLIPFLLFVWKKIITRAEIPTLALLFVLGAGQGVLGWAMVASGLRDRPEVSHYRLAAHLFAALILYAALLWTGFDRLTQPEIRPLNKGLRSAKRHLRIILILLCLAIPAGALVAGLHAGLIYNSWPDMNGHVLPEDPFFSAPWWINVFENPGLAQFDHRIGAYVVAGTAIFIFARGVKLAGWAKKSAKAVAVITAIQIFLGISTLLLMAPEWLAAIHQIAAALLFSAAVWHAYELRHAAA
jgi:cytochrome c oxidase assembly protein subunit 15